jgi:hypothetical protein
MVMSARRSTEEVIARLANALEPVQPIAALRRQGGAIALAWAASAAVAAVWLGLHPLDAVARGAISTLLLGALALIGSASVLLGLACRIPGRERVALAAAIAAVLGALALLAIGFAVPGPIADATALSRGADCSERSLLLALPAGLLAASLAVRGAPWRSRVAGLALAVGAAALGGSLVHASCASPSPAHWLTAHALVPLAVGAATGVGVAWRFDRLAQRSRRALALGA